MSRYQRQIQLQELGSEGQERLGRASVLLIGCGALGSVSAAALVRAGLGHLRLVDGDRVELINLHRQFLYDEADAASGALKAEIAMRKLQQMNSTVQVEGLVDTVDEHNIDHYLTGVDLVLDGTDNLETRHVINKACIGQSIPWIYGGVVGTTGMMMSVHPHQGPCLRCLFPALPVPGSIPTVESHGVLSTAPAMIAAMQVTEAIKIIQKQSTPGFLHVLELWQGSWQKIPVDQDHSCPVCGLNQNIKST